MKKKALIYIMGLILLLLTPIVLGADWTQYTPSPTTNQIIDVAIASNGLALAVTSA